MRLDKIAQIVSEIKKIDKPILIGVSGFGGSGKSSLSKTLSIELDAQVISIDDFAKDVDLQNFTFWNLMDFNRLEKEILIPLINKKSEICYGKFDWESNKINTKVSISKEIIIIEGVGLFSVDLFNYFDYSIWVDCDIDEAIKRGKARDKDLYNVNNDIHWDGVWRRNDLECFENYDILNKVNHIYDNRKS